MPVLTMDPITESCSNHKLKSQQEEFLLHNKLPHYTHTLIFL